MSLEPITGFPEIALPFTVYASITALASAIDLATEPSVVALPFNLAIAAVLSATAPLARESV